MRVGNRKTFLRIWRGAARRALPLFLLVFQSLFLNVIVPGHTRGIITMSGKVGAISLADLGCPMCRAAALTHGDGKDRHAPTKKEQADCAICNLAIRLMAGGVVLWTPVLLPSIEHAPDPAPIVVGVPALPIFHSRAPPAPIA